MSRAEFSAFELDDSFRRFSTTVYKKTNTNKHSKHLKRLDQKQPVLVIRRVMGSNGRHTKTEIDIRGQELCEVLMKIHQGVEGLDLLRSPPVCDLKLLFFSFNELKEQLELEKSKSTPNTLLISEIEVALHFIWEEHKTTFADYQSLTRHGSITFDLLWTLFRHGTLVFNRHEFTEQDHILRTTRFEIMKTNEGIFAAIHCHVITDNGKHFGIANQRFLIPSFEGERKIQSLSIFPLSIHSNECEIRKFAAKRGRKFASLQCQTYGEISGMAACVNDHSMDNHRDLRKCKAHGRVMIDPCAFRTVRPDSSLNVPVSTPLKRAELEEEQYMICTPVVIGFCFATKQWGGFALDCLRDVSWSSDPFSYLVLDDEHKKLIRALVEQHARGSTFHDFVRGTGLVGLLAGPPGCGKTLTVEAAAEVVKRPLYCISAGELGSSPQGIDNALTQILELAQRWKAVVLLDEADVFLSQRMETDVPERNAIVSIFLRQLEYYQGIMFLTTNLISRCDAAFESRIHFTVHYPPLSDVSRRQIWKTFIDKTPNACQSLVSEAEIDALAKETLNGRQVC
ncbi:P-loop containing nucleoside triphosphate hydrolase protein [Suillus bovinus]|uniref:P-loop containing nucleoside triphosphate hydrolase protein n=1 Tax=Suillus bovinus TaxID=48563 RepID=UPI001B87E4B5|nr:P-loop containing nucleoside triphosphate hydrolase protein [Suillus bovinus]KAG2153016.1 P-loop containing nucleoside triphosphate hydrolase protein [Suillus bovinus]